MKTVKFGEKAHFSCQALSRVIDRICYLVSWVRACQFLLASSASGSVALLSVVRCGSAGFVLSAVAQRLGSFVKLSRQLRISSHFHRGGSVLASVLGSVSNMPSFNKGTLSNNKGFKYVRKLTGSPLCGSRLSWRYALVAK